mgnify:CR=1 FL=1
MRSIAVSALLVAAVASAESPDIFTYGGCQRLSPDARAKIAALDRSYSVRAASDALKELAARVGAPRETPLPYRPTNSDLVRIVEGWLLKKTWLDAVFRREHDVDEAGEYCGFLMKEAHAEPGI